MPTRADGRDRASPSQTSARVGMAPDFGSLMRQRGATGLWMNANRSAICWGSIADSKPAGIRDWLVLVRDLSDARGTAWSFASRVLIVTLPADSVVTRPVSVVLSAVVAV